MPIWYVLVKRGPDSPTWKAVEKRVGKLDFAVLARNLNQVAKDYKISAVADPEQAAPFFEWLTDYAGLLAERGRVVPPELKDADPRTYRLLQARQIDSGWLGRDWWRKMPNASDGWALMCPSNRWLIQHHLSPWDEYEVGRTYRLFVRVKGGEKKKDGMAFACGVGNTNKEFPVDALADGRFHVLEVGEVKAEEQLRIWFALSKQMAMSEVFLDCLWLVPQPD